jgi:hypothetical protein
VVLERSPNGATKEETILSDQNSLWGELNIQKRELWVKGILAQDLGFVWGPFQRGFGGFLNTYESNPPEFNDNILRFSLFVRPNGSEYPRDHTLSFSRPLPSANIFARSVIKVL